MTNVAATATTNARESVCRTVSFARHEGRQAAVERRVDMAEQNTTAARAALSILLEPKEALWACLNCSSIS